VLNRHGLDPAGRYILYVGGISPHKNLDTLLAAFAAVRDDPRAKDVRLVLVGDYAGDAFLTCYEDLCRQVESLGLGDAVVFPGFVPDSDLAHLYAGCRAFVLPSYLEGFGLPVVEAMACGAPVLVSDRGSLPEVVDSAGHRFDPTQPTAIAEAMLAVLTDDAYRDDQKRRSAARAETFSWERSARQMNDILHEVASPAS
jgi:glycosyltransferase involved in cell wall biosynthesis